MPAPKGNKNAVGNKGGNGAPPLYKPRFVEMAKQACAAGFTDFQLAQLLGVSEMTINVWKVKHVDFGLALKDWKAYADEQVERSLYAKARGYSFDAEKIAVNADGQVTRVAYVEHVPPSDTANIFWLKNRRSQDWRDRIEHTGANGGAISFSIEGMGEKATEAPAQLASESPATLEGTYRDVTAEREPGSGA